MKLKSEAFVSSKPNRPKLDLIKWLILDKLLKIRQNTTRSMNLNRFQGFLKSLDLSRTRENYEELVKIKQLQAKFFYKQQRLMELSEQMIFIVHNCETELDQLNVTASDELPQRYIHLSQRNQDLLRSFVTNFELALQQYKTISSKIDLVLKDALILLFNSVLSEQDYLLTKSYLTKILNQFRTRMRQLEEAYKYFKSFLNDKAAQNRSDVNNNENA